MPVKFFAVTAIAVLVAGFGGFLTSRYLSDRELLGRNFNLVAEVPIKPIQNGELSEAKPEIKSAATARIPENKVVTQKKTDNFSIVSPSAGLASAHDVAKPKTSKQPLEASKSPTIVPPPAPAAVSPPPPILPPLPNPTICNFITSRSPSRVGLIINEVAWMGTQTSANDEWIELKNISASEISISGWWLLDQSENIKVSFDAGEKIPAGGFYLLERTSDASVPNRTADKTYVGALSNTGDGLRLFNSQCNLIDEVLANPEWPAGTASPEYRAMERGNDLSWHTYSGGGGNGVFGTPKAENSLPAISPAPAPNPPPPAPQSSPPPPAPEPTPPPPAPAPEPTPPPPAPTPSPPSTKLLISEVFIDMEGADTQEFVEIYNPNDSAVDLSLWSLQYLSGSASSFGSISKKNFTAPATIPAHGFYLVGVGGYTGSVSTDMTWSQSLNNTGATIFLVNDHAEVTGSDDTNIVGRVGYGTGTLYGEGGAAPLPPAGQSIERKASGCVSAQGSGENSGNGCDTETNDADFEIRSAPNPQNVQSQAE